MGLVCTQNEPRLGGSQRVAVGHHKELREQHTGASARDVRWPDPVVVVRTPGCMAKGRSQQTDRWL